MDIRTRVRLIKQPEGDGNLAFIRGHIPQLDKDIMTDIAIDYGVSFSQVLALAVAEFMDRQSQLHNIPTRVNNFITQLDINKKENELNILMKHARNLNREALAYENKN